jgi:hypothetical protein
MSQKPKFYFEISCDGREYDSGSGMWACYDLIVTQGNTLDELFDNASVSIINQDGGELRCSPMRADSAWMQDLIENQFLNEMIKGAGDLEDGEVGMGDCMLQYCIDNQIDQSLGVKALNLWTEREAQAAGIPLSVIRGKTKLSDHFSKEFIENQCNPHRGIDPTQCSNYSDEWERKP